MGRKGFVHFERHRREVVQTRRRFRVSILLLSLMLSVAAGLQFRQSQAAANVTLSGRVFSSATGAGVANVKLRLCYNNTTMITNASGGWSLIVPYQARYCSDVMSGLPANTQKVEAVYYNPEHPSPHG
jgi:hypothetical protein